MAVSAAAVTAKLVAVLPFSISAMETTAEP